MKKKIDMKRKPYTKGRISGDEDAPRVEDNKPRKIDAVIVNIRNLLLFVYSLSLLNILSSKLDLGVKFPHQTLLSDCKNTLKEKTIKIIKYPIKKFSSTMLKNGIR